MSPGTLRSLGLAAFVLGLLFMLFVIVNSQLMQSYQMQSTGPFNTTSLAPYTYKNADDSNFTLVSNPAFNYFGPSYDDGPLLGGLGLISLAGFFAWQYYRTAEERSPDGVPRARWIPGGRVSLAAAKAAFVFGFLGAAIVYFNGQVLQAFYVSSPSPLFSSDVSVVRYLANPLFSPCAVVYKNYCFAFDMYPNDVIVIEIFGLVSMAGFVAWRYWAKVANTGIRSRFDRRALAGALGSAISVFAGLGAAAILLLIPVANSSIQLAGVYYGAVGYPWWVERLHTQPSTCWIQGPYVRPNCEFLNYGDIFWGLLILALVGGLAWYRYSRPPRLAAGREEVGAMGAPGADDLDHGRRAHGDSRTTTATPNTSSRGTCCTVG